MRDIKVGDILYRAQLYTEDNEVHCDRYKVVKLTPQGMWISLLRFKYADDYREWRSSLTRYVSRTEEEALNQLIRRTASWVRIAQEKLKRAEQKYRRLTGQDYPERLL